MNSPLFKNMTGQRFGRFLVLEKSKSTRDGVYWKCICDCGEIRIVKGYSLRKGITKSCSCLHHEEMSKRLSSAPGECAFNQCLHNYQWGAKKRGISFELTKEQFRELTQGACFYCGDGPTQEIKVPSNNGSYVYNGIDRLNSDLGYTVENCVSACGTHNLMKLDMSVEQFILACQKVSDHQALKHSEV